MPESRQISMQKPWVTLDLGRQKPTETIRHHHSTASLRRCRHVHSDQACRTTYTQDSRTAQGSIKMSPSDFYHLLRCPSDDLRLSAELREVCRINFQSRDRYDTRVCNSIHPAREHV